MTSLTSDKLVYLIGVTSLITLVLQAYNSVIKPQYKSDKDDALLNQQVKDLAKNTADQLLQMSKDFANLRDNHIHTLQIAQDNNSTQITDLRVTVTKLATIIDERIPKKQ